MEMRNGEKKDCGTLEYSELLVFQLRSIATDWQLYIFHGAAQKRDCCYVCMLY